MKKLKIGLLLICILCLTGCSKSYVKEISYDEYKKLVKNKETFILEVMREDCSACQTFKPKLESVAKEYEVEVKAISTDNLSNEELNEFGITGTPTVIFYIDGEEQTTASRINGSVNKDKIISKFKASGFIKE